MKLTLISTTSSSAKKSFMTVKDEVFDRPNPILFAQAIRIYLSNQRQGSSKVKTRSEVNRTTKKMYRQKGTGGARHGARDANIFVGGGVSHGPTGLENWTKLLTKKFRKLSLAAALTAQSSHIFVNDEVESLSGKTKAAVELLTNIATKAKDEKIQVGKSRILLVMDQVPATVRRSVNNIPNVTILSARLVNALSLSRAHLIIASTKAVELLETRVIAK
ncbi:MAG TPA: 50S ribosomal protein L4 [Candidatus Woesebacteria bacterium]|nr:50S ribosomal protein L4 [Candidatus Woesebacteria bacterium]